MKCDILLKFTIILTMVGVLLLAATTSCDTPKSIAWSYYYCAVDTLAAGDPYAAKHFLKSCHKTVDKALTVKADSLMEVIEATIVEQEKKQS